LKDTCYPFRGAIEKSNPTKFHKEMPIICEINYPFKRYIYIYICAEEIMYILIHVLMRNISWRSNPIDFVHHKAREHFFLYKLLHLSSRTICNGREYSHTLTSKKIPIPCLSLTISGRRTCISFFSQRKSTRGSTHSHTSNPEEEFQMTS
jgi:hypothetical protein